MSDYEVILGHYGEESQMLKAIEEMGELTSVLIRTILNIDSYEVTAMIWAMNEYMHNRQLAERI